MDQLKNILKNEVEKFPMYEPSKDHHRRFEKKLNQGLMQLQWRKAIIATSVAVMISVLMMTVYFVLPSTDLIVPTSKRVLAQTEIEYIDAENYYQSRIDDELNKLLLNLDKKAFNKVVSELSDIDKSFALLKKDLDGNPGDIRIINAILNCYQLKIETLEVIIEKSQETKKSDNYL